MTPKPQLIRLALRRWASFLVFASLLPASILGVSASGLVQQTLSLHAGWNAVWIDVTPVDKSPAAVFAGVPLESVWTYQKRVAAVDFIQNADEPIWNRNQWLSYAPTNRPESVANNLFAIPGQRAYLIRVSAPATVVLTGSPEFRPADWVPDSFNLRGFPVDDGVGISFLDFFRNSSAHYNSTTSQLQPIYRLNASGAWQRVAPGDLMQAGVCYWVYSKGGSKYLAPFEFAPSLGGSDLDYGLVADAYDLRLRNLRKSGVGATIGELAPPPKTPLATSRLDPIKGVVWTALPALLSVPLDPLAATTVELGGRRQVMTGTSYDSVLEIRDNQGIRFLIPVHIKRTPIASGVATAGARELADVPAAKTSHAGLWLGTITVNGVSEPHSGNLVTNRFGPSQNPGDPPVPLEVTRSGINTNPTPTQSSSLSLRVLIHVDQDGTPRLLKEVVQLWKVGKRGKDAQGNSIVLERGQPVLVTDEVKFRNYQGASFKNDSLAGRRFSAIGFDFPPLGGSNNVDNFLPLQGVFKGGTNVSGRITLSPDARTNPYKHKFHPDHDNLNDRFDDYKQEAFEIKRDFVLEFAAVDPGGSPGADYGYAELAGVYREVVTGLHRVPITAQGTFRIRRVSEISKLNP